MARRHTQWASEIAASSYSLSLVFNFLGKIVTLRYFIVFAKAYRECRNGCLLHSLVNV